MRSELCRIFVVLFPVFFIQHFVIFLKSRSVREAPGDQGIQAPGDQGIQASEDQGLQAPEDQAPGDQGIQAMDHIPKTWPMKHNDNDYFKKIARLVTGWIIYSWLWPAKLSGFQQLEI